MMVLQCCHCRLKPAEAIHLAFYLMRVCVCVCVCVCAHAQYPKAQQPPVLFDTVVHSSVLTRLPSHSTFPQTARFSSNNQYAFTGAEKIRERRLL